MYLGLNLTMAVIITFSSLPQLMETIYSTTNVVKSITYVGYTASKKPYVMAELDALCNGCTGVAGYSITLENSKGVAEYFESFTITYLTRATIQHEIRDPINEYETKRKIWLSFNFTKNTSSAQQIYSLDIYHEPNTTYNISSLFSHSPGVPYKIVRAANGSINSYYERFVFDKLIDMKLIKMAIDPTKFILDYWNTQYESLGLYSNETFLLIDKIYDGSDIPTLYGSYKFPLKIKCTTVTCNFELLDTYYYDQEAKMLFITNGANRRVTKTLTIPPQFAKQSITFELHLINAGSSKQNYIVRSTLSTSLNAFGDCENSYYCISKVNEILDDVEYKVGE